MSKQNKKHEREREGNLKSHDNREKNGFVSGENEPILVTVVRWLSFSWEKGEGIRGCYWIHPNGQSGQLHWHDAFIFVPRFFPMRAITHSHVSRDAFKMWDHSFVCVTWPDSFLLCLSLSLFLSLHPFLSYLMSLPAPLPLSRYENEHTQPGIQATGGFVICPAS